MQLSEISDLCRMPISSDCTQPRLSLMMFAAMDSPFANFMTIIDFFVHVHTVGINVQMENATFGITMQGDYVLRSFEVGLL